MVLCCHVPHLRRRRVRRRRMYGRRNLINRTTRAHLSVTPARGKPMVGRLCLCLRLGPSATFPSIMVLCCHVPHLRRRRVRRRRMYGRRNLINRTTRAHLSVTPARGKPMVGRLCLCLRLGPSATFPSIMVLCCHVPHLRRRRVRRRRMYGRRNLINRTTRAHLSITPARGKPMVGRLCLCLRLGPSATFPSIMVLCCHVPHLRLCRRRHIEHKHICDSMNVQVLSVSIGHPTSVFLCDV
ncbi:hypothetical protein EUGRSUZ_B02136 [Eucalyptus grandis]|uniref:Uncharacterized protein n=2 Tax=Eucalyptus grandis TaxID=71139 RepID=A0ACC3LSR5_EUCGR|nr:hypothetical protein EUGRSUZ_B02136 [Eucalyptus grandis]